MTHDDKEWKLIVHDIHLGFENDSTDQITAKPNQAKTKPSHKNKTNTNRKQNTQNSHSRNKAIHIIWINFILSYSHAQAEWIFVYLYTNIERETA